MVRVAAIEAGGTKFVAGIIRQDAPGSLPVVEERFRIPTTSPKETLSAVASWFEDARTRYSHAEGSGISALGVASFGPLAGTYGSPGWGRIGRTPKPGWSDFDLPEALRAATGLQPVIDTDVNAAALAEGQWGAARGLDDFVYVTVGTGIGGGVVSGGRLLHGASHPETGHVPVPREPDDAFAGRCPFHGACLEGMASGPAIGERWAAPAETLPPDHPAWDLEARYLASGFLPLVFVLATGRIILGGGVGGAPGLIERVRAHLLDRAGGYAPRLEAPGAMDEFIVPPGLGADAGLLGAAALVVPRG